MTITVVALLIAVAALGAPLFIVLGAGSLYAAHATGLDPAVLVAEMLRLASSPNLMAIPLFTLAGVVLSRGGAPERLLRVFNAGFGWMPGGLAIVALTACAFFTAFSGASGVTILALGGLLFPMLRDENYSRNFSLGLLTSSGSLGLLFPPSLVILLYGIVAGVSIEQLFLAGLVPGLLLLAMLALYSAGVSRHIGITPRPFSLSALFPACGPACGICCCPSQSSWDCSAATSPPPRRPVARRPTRCCSKQQYTAVFVSASQLYEIFRETIILVGTLLIILGIALGFTNLLIDAQIPMKILAALEQGVSSQLQFLLLLNAFLLVVGCIMDIFSAIVVVVPLILPLAQRFGVDPVHLGIVFLANLEIGYLTPPVGINLFLASQRFRNRC